MQKYKHKQTGLLGFGIVGFLIFLIVSKEGVDALVASPEILFLFLFVLFLIYSFSSLTVSVDELYVKIRFSYGFYQKFISLAMLDEVSTAKNKWYYGWGIRYWFWPPMTIYNVAGYDAVELKMKNGKIIRIGTDEPAKLKRAILQHLERYKDGSTSSFKR